MCDVDLELATKQSERTTLLVLHMCISHDIMALNSYVDVTMLDAEEHHTFTWRTTLNALQIAYSNKRRGGITKCCLSLC